MTHAAELKSWNNRWWYDEEFTTFTTTHNPDYLYSSGQEQNNNIMDNDRVQDRVMYLEEREKHLVKETHELREQNELLEFRILELEENQDKVMRDEWMCDRSELWYESLCSNNLFKEFLIQHFKVSQAYIVTTLDSLDSIDSISYFNCA